MAERLFDRDPILDKQAKRLLDLAYQGLILRANQRMKLLQYTGDLNDDAYAEVRRQRHKASFIIESAHQTRTAIRRLLSEDV